MARDERLLQAVEVGTLAIGSTLVALPGVVVRVAGIGDPDSEAPVLVRTVGFWTTGFGALLQFVEDDAERDRLLMAGAAIASASVVEGFRGAIRKRTTWRAAITQLVLAGSLAGAACAYLAE